MWGAIAARALFNFGCFRFKIFACVILLLEGRQFYFSQYNADAEEI